MANGERNAAKETHWREVMGRHVASGLSVRAFCRQEGIGQPSFYFWRRKIRTREAEPAPAAVPAFVPAVVRGVSRGEEPILVEWNPNLRLRLPATISATWVAEVLRAVRAGGER